MEFGFTYNIENMVMLFHSIIGESMAMEDLKKGGLSKHEVSHRSEVILECREFFNGSYGLPGAGIA